MKKTIVSGEYSLLNIGQTIKKTNPKHFSNWIFYLRFYMPNKGLHEERRLQYAQAFISRANLKHNNVYNYDKSKYINRREKVEIVCEKHGSFWKLPQAHERGEGCPYCNNRAKNTKIIVEEFKIVHGDRYDYSEVEYTKARLPVIIKCKEHGCFEQAPSEHKRGKGCMKCCYKQRSNTIKQTLARKRQEASTSDNFG